MTSNNLSIKCIGRGLFEISDGRYLALTFTRAKWFKTKKGAVNWLMRHYNKVKSC